MGNPQFFYFFLFYYFFFFSYNMTAFQFDDFESRIALNQSDCVDSCSGHGICWYRLETPEVKNKKKKYRERFLFFRLFFPYIIITVTFLSFFFYFHSSQLHFIFILLFLFLSPLFHNNKHFNFFPFFTILKFIYNLPL